MLSGTVLIVFIFLCALSATVDAKLDEYVASLIPAAILFPVKLATFFLYGFFLIQIDIFPLSRNFTNFLKNGLLA